MAERGGLIDKRRSARQAEVGEPTPEGIKFRRFYTSAGRNPMDGVEWVKRTAVIKGEDGHVIFEQKDVEAPEFWSDMALNVVVSRYFRGVPGTPTREKSIRNVILRVVNTIQNWGIEQGYFARDADAAIFRDELTHLILHQKASFNSPVWFNLGVEASPQCSACFILSVEDTLESILEWYSQEGLIFKGGSGSGVNLSRLRSSREPLGGGGTASGPVSFMKAADASAGVIKSGGKTRRAAKMVILDIDHPDIVEFINSKAGEEAKARVLIEAGYRKDVGGEAYSTVAFQNSNHSVRVSDAFMEAYEKGAEWQTHFLLTGRVADTHRASDLIGQIAGAAHACGDPGMQFDSTINRWHTCPKTAPIRASNPCSEYMHVDDSACNLASLRLTGFLDDGGNADGLQVDAFLHAVDIMITAQEILVDKAGYPSEAIRHNSMNMRALGLGYADLGAALMQLGIPYDSDKGRTWASLVTAIMSGAAYAHSARLASVRGPFSQFEQNRDDMLHVIRMHRNHLRGIAKAPGHEELLSEALKVWDNALQMGEKHGYRNCQVTVLAPTGTVGFMMDCDTTGIEPEMALVKYKSLAGGGRLKMVNKSVPRALSRLGYSEESARSIVAKVEEIGTIEGIEALLPDHLPAFDCAFRPVKGTRSISPQGHLLMMAAVQPFLSGAISKTVNLPNQTTVDEIEKIFHMAWRLGLKAVAVYRDGCKSVQPLSLVESLPGGERRPVRRRLPVDCTAVRHKFEVAGQKGYLHTGFYEDGKVGEIFICMAKEGSTISGLMDTIATLTSIALQYGVPLEALVSKFSHVRFEPSGFTSNPQIPIAKSLTDYIFRYLGLNLLTKEQQEAVGLLAPAEASETRDTPHSEEGTPTPPLKNKKKSPHAFNLQSDAPSCQDCGAIMVRNGSCYKCLNCGGTTGCS